MSYRRGRAITGALLLVAVVGPSGCATKGFVRGEVSGLRTRVDQVATSADQANELARTSDQHAAQANQQAAEANQQAQIARQIALGNIKREEIRTVTVHFAFDSAKLKDEDRSNLDGVIEDLKNNPAYMALLSGYTDSTGDDDYNVGLARRRADAVNRYLAENLGNDFVRIATIGLGEIRPVAENNSREGRSQNRRVDVSLVRPMPAEGGSNPPTAAR